MARLSSRRRFLRAALALGASAACGLAWAVDDEPLGSATRRGLEFLYRASRRPSVFVANAGDFLWCFHCIATTSADEALASRAADMARERAQAWRALHRRPLAQLSAPALADFAYDAFAADQIGPPDEVLRQAVREQAAQFSTTAFLRFDPKREAAPRDVPYPCDRCGRDNRRGLRRCAHCGGPLWWRSRYDVLCDALTTTYFGQRYGVWLGAELADVTATLAAVRPYPRPSRGPDLDFRAAIYAVTHVVYVLSDYCATRLAPAQLAAEFAFLNDGFDAALASRNPDALGEFLDTLATFGVPYDDPRIGHARARLLGLQQADGAWRTGARETDFNRFHPTWTAVDGLREHRFADAPPRYPDALAAAQG